ncbi:MAG: hypothetical protein ABI876_01150 [Bacteroidota bacterium]
MKDLAGSSICAAAGRQSQSFLAALRAFVLLRMNIWFDQFKYVSSISSLQKKGSRVGFPLFIRFGFLPINNQKS